MSHYDDYRNRHWISGKASEALSRYCKEGNMEEAQPTPNKYQKRLRNNIAIDVYAVLDAFKVENPAVQHAIKKMLCAGQRGYKDYEQDLDEAIQSLERAKDFPPIPF